MTNITVSTLDNYVNLTNIIHRLHGLIFLYNDEETTTLYNATKFMHYHFFNTEAMVST